MFSENRRTAYFLLLLILAIAAGYRFWKLGDLPPGLYHDEAYNGLDALSLIQGKEFPQFYEGWELYAEDAHADRPPIKTRFPIFFEGNYGREPFHIYLMALSIALLDATPLAIRFVPALAGVVAVLTTFWAARAMFPKQGYFLPLLAAGTITILYPAVHFSRFGIRAMLFVPFETMAVACFMKGITAGENTDAGKEDIRTWIWFLAAGTFLGLSIYTFAAARLFPLLWIVFVPLWFILEEGAFRRFGAKIAAMALLALAWAAPLLIFFFKFPYFFLFRIAYVANKGKGTFPDKPWLTWILNMGRVLRGFIFLGETHLRHNLPGRPYLDSIQGIFFVIGLARAVRHLLNPRYLFLVLWFGVMLLPSILSGDAPHFGRLVGAAAPVAILIAIGFLWLFSMLLIGLQKRFPAKMATAISAGFMIFLILASASWTAWDYFVRFAQHPDLAIDFYESDWNAGLYASGFGENLDVYLSPSQEELATIIFALKNPDLLRNYNGGETLFPAGRAGSDMLFLFKDFDIEALPNLQSVFADGVWQEPVGDFLPFFVPADSPRNYVSSAEIPFGEEIILVGWTKMVRGGQLLVTLTWQAMEQMDKDYTVFVHVLGSDGELVAQLDREPAGYPTSDWRPNELVIDQFLLNLPDDFAADQDFQIATGFYYLPTMERLGEPAILGQ